MDLIDKSAVTHASSQSTAVSVLIGAQIPYLILLAPTLSLASAADGTRTALWLFLLMMSAHWWWGAQYYLMFIGPARTLFELYWFFGILTLTWLPIAFLQRIDLFFAFEAAAFLLTWQKYTHVLPELRHQAVRAYVQEKARLDCFAFFLLLTGVPAAIFAPRWLHPWLAAGAGLTELGFTYWLVAVRRLYARLEIAAAGWDEAAPGGQGVRAVKAQS